MKPNNKILSPPTNNSEINKIIGIGVIADLIYSHLSYKDLFNLAFTSKTCFNNIPTFAFKSATELDVSKAIYFSRLGIISIENSMLFHRCINPNKLMDLDSEEWVTKLKELPSNTYNEYQADEIAKGLHLSLSFNELDNLPIQFKFINAIKEVNDIVEMANYFVTHNNNDNNDETKQMLVILKNITNIDFTPINMDDDIDNENDMDDDIGNENVEHISTDKAEALLNAMIKAGSKPFQICHADTWINALPVEMIYNEEEDAKDMSCILGNIAHIDVFDLYDEDKAKALLNAMIKADSKPLQIYAIDTWINALPLEMIYNKEKNAKDVSCILENINSIDLLDDLETVKAEALLQAMNKAGNLNMENYIRNHIGNNMHQ